MFYVHYLLVVDWSPFNVLCMYSWPSNLYSDLKEVVVKRGKLKEAKTWELILKSIIVC